MPRLPLKQGNRARVFRKIVEQLKADETLSNAVPTFLVWDDSEADGNPIHSGMMPAILLTPQPMWTGWYSEDAHAGMLVINVEIDIESRHADDYLNLWEAVENALYPPGNHEGQLVMEQALRDCGAETGLVEFHGPAWDQQAALSNDGLFNCKGAMRISVVRTLNP